METVVETIVKPVDNLETGLINPVLQNNGQAHISDLNYADLTELVQSNFAASVAKSDVLFLVKNENNALWDAYINSFSDEERQGHNCQCCRHFLRKYGSLVTVDAESGRLQSAIWHSVEETNPWYPTVAAMRRAVESSEIKSFFHERDAVYGKYASGGFTHLALTEVRSIRIKDGKEPVVVREGMAVLQRGLGDVKETVINRAVALFKHHERLSLAPLKFKDSLDRINAVFQSWLTAKDQRLKNNICWYYSARFGFDVTNFRNSVIGQFLDNVTTMGEAGAAGAFMKMTDGEHYMRPSAEPAEGNVDEAARIVDKLGIEKSLYRQAATLADIHETFWKPHQEESRAIDVPEEITDVFGKLKETIKQKEKEAVEPPIQKTVTLDVFVNRILPECKKLSVFITPHPPCSLLTKPLHPDSPSIFKHEINAVNRISWIMFLEPQAAIRWKLKANDWVAGSCIIVLGETGDLRQDLMCILNEGEQPQLSGSGLFPSLLIPELFPVRSTIEAFSNITPLTPSNSSIVGIRFVPGMHVKAVMDNVEVIYFIDRLE